MESGHDPLQDPNTTWYGPHQCRECGVIIVKAALEHGGAEFEPPERLMRVFHRGSESSAPEIVYPMTWTPHQHRPGGRIGDPPSTNAIDPIGGSDLGLSTRDKEET